MPDYSRRQGFADRTALVCGARISGASAARALLDLGARVLVTDSGPASVVASLPAGVEFLGHIARLPPDVDVVVTSPGLRPDNALLRQAKTRRLPVFGELEFAWRIRGDAPAGWLMLTGTNGKTTTVRMLEAMLRAAGRHAMAVGNVGVPIIDAVLAEPPFEVLAVEASSFQLYHSDTIAPHAGALLNIAADHLDWHGAMSDYAAEKTKVWKGDTAIANADDPLVMALLDRDRHHNIVTFTLGEPRPGHYGLARGQLIDAAGHPFAVIEQVRPRGLHNVANALAAAALAATVGVSGEQAAAGIDAFVPDPHRNQLIAEIDGVRYVDDSKATNPHAADASLRDYERVVWIAGGQLKDAPIEELIADHAGRFVGVVLLGVDAPVIGAALARHAPGLPMISVSRTDDMAMQDVVRAAASLAHAGDTVLLAPAAASLDMFASYAARGHAFAAALAAMVGGTPGDTGEGS
jgi:UDP-N-acetylmuramoylalanine--D-glutamate ligase